MALCNCMNCNKLINNINGPELCDECDKLLFGIVREYLYNNPSSDIKKISEETEVPIKIIRAFLDDERLQEIRKDINTCELCGDVALEGSMYCSNCLKKIKAVRGLNSAYNDYNSQTSNSPRMHYLNSEPRKRR